MLQESTCESLCTSATEGATDNQNTLSVRAEDLWGQVPGRRLLEIWIEQLHEGGFEQRKWVATDIEFLSECLFFSQSQAHGRFMRALDLVKIVNYRLVKFTIMAVVNVLLSRFTQV